MAALKETEGKVPLDLVDPNLMVEVAKVLAFGAQKYSRWDWLEGLSFSQIQGAMLRHLTSWIEGEDVAPDSGLSHIAHLAANAMFILRFIKDNRLELDDRVFKNRATTELPTIEVNYYDH